MNSENELSISTINEDNASSIRLSNGRSATQQSASDKLPKEQDTANSMRSEELAAPVSHIGAQQHLAAQTFRTIPLWFVTNTFSPTWLPRSLRHPLLGYLFAVILQVITVTITMGIVRLFPTFAYPGLLQILSIVLIAINWGAGPGLLATFTGIILLNFVALPGHFVLDLDGIDDWGEVVLFLLVGLTISIVGGRVEQARRKAEELATSLVTERAHLEAIIETVPHAVSIHDAQGKVVRLNRIGRQNAGPNRGNETLDEAQQAYTVRTATGEPFPVEEFPVARALRGETVSNVEARYLDAAGNDRSILISAAPLLASQSKVEGVVLITHDITALRQTEQQAAKLERRTHEVLNALLEMAETLVLTSDDTISTGELTLSGLGRVAQRLVELTRQVMGCQRVSITAVEPETNELRSVAVIGISPEQEHAWRSRRPGFYLSDMVNDSNPSSFPGNDVLVIDMTRPPYSEYPNPYNIHLMLLAPMTVGDQLVGVLSIDYGNEAHEYTAEERALAAAVGKLGALVLERERLLRERAEARANELALRKANRRMEEFLGMISHELKTPLTSIKGNTQLAMRQLKNSLQTFERMLELHEATERQSRRLHRLVDDLLDVSRTQTGHLELRLAPCDLTTIIQGSIEEQRQLWPERVIDLDLPEETIPPIYADADRIGQVITNYLTNALKYSPEDRPVHVKLRQSAEEVGVSVQDEGPGLSPEDAQLIWERFQRVPGIEVQDTSPASNVGLGLGLYISKTIIEGHQGRVGAETTPGQGSTFWFTLPLTKQDSPETSGDGEA